MDKTELRERIRFRRTALKELRNAYIGLVDGRHKSYTIGPRTLTRLDLDELAKEIRQMENELDAMESQATGGGSRRIVGVIPRGW